MRSTLRSFLLLLALATTWQGASLANAATTARNLEVAVVVDNALYVALGSSEPAAQAFANEVMSGLLPITGPDLSIRVQTVSVVVRTGADGWTATTTSGGETSSTSLLSNFTTWAAANLSTPYDVPVLLSGRNFDGSTIGLAGVGVACAGPSRSSAIVQATFATPYVTTVVAHELGHTLGMGHDGSGSSNNCPSSGFIMAAVGCSNCGSLPTHYSTCSVTEFAKWFSLANACLLDDVPSCGNGVRQMGEQCDSGADWSTDACCTPWWSADGCQLEPGCGCAVSDGCCTAGTPDAAGTACRPATSVCDVAEQCDGTSSFCPPDLHGAIGTPCGTDGACGPGGTCASPYAQCLTMPSLGYQVTILGACPAFTTCSMLACTVTSTGGCTTFTLSATTSVAPAPGTPCGDGMVCDGAACVPAASVDECPYDDNKTAEGICGCGVPDIDTDEDGLADCVDRCPQADADPSCALCQVNTDCDDNDPSTIDTCDPQGTCVHETDRCAGVSCNDGNVCTTDSCTPTTGACVYTNNTAPCDDSTVCNGREVCGGGTCQPGTPLNCNDNNGCTDDACHAQTGCVNAPAPTTTSCTGISNSGTCDGADFCDGSGHCVDGYLSASTACRPSTGECDPAEFCSGIGASCPVDTGNSCGFRDNSQITPGNTTCQQYVSSTSADLDTVQYLRKGNTSPVSSTSPGVLSLYDGVHLGSLGSIGVVENNPAPTWKRRLPVQSATNGRPQVVIYDRNCNVVYNWSNNQTYSATLELGSGTTLGNVKINNVPAGDYIVSVKYNADVAGCTSSDCPNPGTAYSFVVTVGGAASGSDSVTYTKK